MKQSHYFHKIATNDNRKKKKKEEEIKSNN